MKMYKTINFKTSFKTITTAVIILFLNSTVAQNPVWAEDFENLATNSNYFGISSTKILASGGVNNSKCVEVEYERHQNGGTPRYLHKVNITPGTEYTLSYDIFFDNDWNISTGGKYHGLVPNNTTSGCAPIEADGWSCRVVFDDRNPYLYTYHQDKNATCGDKSRNINLQLNKNQWYAVSMHLKLNTADNVNDGFAKLYINGTLVATQNNREFRSVINNATKITQFYFCTFLGAGPTGAIKTRNHARFDNFGVYPGESIRNTTGGNTVNTSPIVTITAPSNNAVYNLGETIHLAANATDSNGSISKVNFKINNSYYSTDTTAPYTGNFTPTTTGTYKIAARAFDNTNTATEKFVTITVVKPQSSNFIINATTSANGSISPSGSVTIASGTNKTFTFSPYNGYIIDKILVNGVSVGAVSSYTLTNITSNQTISASFKPVTTISNCLLTTFGVPRTASLPTKNQVYNKIHTLGNNAPNLSNITTATLNWNLTYKGLYELSFNTSNGNPKWWIDLKNNAQNFAQSQPSITFNGTGISNLDGNKYYVNYVTSSSNFVLVEVNGQHAIYFSNSNTPPSVCNNINLRAFTANENELVVFPNPSPFGIFELSQEKPWELWSSTGLKLEEGNGTLINLEAKPQGVYFLKTEEKVFQLVRE